MSELYIGDKAGRECTGCKRAVPHEYDVRIDRGYNCMKFPCETVNQVVRESMQCEEDRVNCSKHAKCGYYFSHSRKCKSIKFKQAVKTESGEFEL